MATAPPRPGVNSAKPEPRSCLGVLFYNQLRHDLGRPPACAGIKRRKEAGAVLNGSPDALPSGDFKFMCVGYSAYDEAALRDAGRNSKPGEPITMPACEGIEVVAAAHGQHNPRLMPEGPQADLPPLAATREAEGRPAKPRPGISYVPGVPSQDGFDYAQFAKRYDEQVRKLLTRMGKNADYMVTYAKQQWQTFVGSGERRH